MTLTPEQLVANHVGSQQIEIIHLKAQNAALQARVAMLEDELAQAGATIRDMNERKTVLKPFLADPADEESTN